MTLELFLRWIAARYWTIFGVIAGLAVISGAITGWIAKRLSPKVIQLELAETVAEADRILAEWGEDGKRTARRAIYADYLFALFYPPACALLLMGMASNLYFRDVLPVGLVVAGSVLTAGIWDWLENTAMLLTLKRIRPTTVDAARWFARIKFGLLALGITYVFFWCFYYVGRVITFIAQGYSELVSLVLVICVASIGTLLIVTEWRLKPPLLMLQLAPTRSAVNRLLVRWDDSQHKAAKRAILIDLLFVLLYTAVSALFFATAVRPGASGPFLQNLARVAGWSMVAAAAFQWVQDWGAFYTLQVRRAGWWLQPTRVAGIARIELIKLAAIIAIVFLIKWEVWHLARQIRPLIAWMASKFVG
jgi:hypothetical protein